MVVMRSLVRLVRYAPLSIVFNEFLLISNHTKNQLSRYTSKKIVNIPFWADPKIWFDIEDMISIRRDFNIPTNSYLIGSFQRDTEGHDLISPNTVIVQISRIVIK